MTWRNVFLVARCDCEVLGETRVHAHSRKRAILRAEQWMLERTKYSDGLGAIYPAMMYVDHGAGCAWLCAGPPGPSRGAAAVRRV